MYLSPKDREAVSKIVAEGKYVTEAKLRRFSPTLLERCKHHGEREFADSRFPWRAALAHAYFRPRCLTCGSHRLTFLNFRRGFIRHCSSICAGKNPDTDTKRVETNQERYSARRPQQEIPKIRAKFRKTMRDRFGCEYGGQSEELRLKAITTAMKDGGFSTERELRQHYVKKSRATCRERYGASHPFAVRSIFEKHRNSFYRHKKVRVSGRVFSVQGYEHHVIRWLVDKGVDPNKIKITAKDGNPTVRYRDRGKWRHYFPDMYVLYKGRWTIVEVKSYYTLGIVRTPSKAEEFQRVKKKARRCIKLGYPFLLVVVVKKNGKMTPVEVDDVVSKTRREVRLELGLPRRLVRKPPPRKRSS